MNEGRSTVDRRTFLRGAAILGGSALAMGVVPAASAGIRKRTRMMATTRMVGKLAVTCLVDASGPFELASPAEAFPSAAEQDWVAARAIDPDAFGADGRWHLTFRCFLIEGPGSRLTLVDTGVGPAGSPASEWAPVPGRLLDALSDLGMAAEDIDVVVQTHLHSDHLGWAVMPDGRPVFPRARYVVQLAEVAVLEEAGSALVPYLIEPLRRTGQLAEITGETRLAGGRGRAGHRIVAIPTPGHTPGHQSVLVTDAGKQIVITGDVLVHAVQLANPDIEYAFESDQDLARTVRRGLLDRARADGALLATAHLNRPFLSVP